MYLAEFVRVIPESEEVLLIRPKFVAWCERLSRCSSTSGSRVPMEEFRNHPIAPFWKDIGYT